MQRVREALRADVAGARRSVLTVVSGATLADVVCLFLVVPGLLLAVEGLIRSGGVFAPIERSVLRFPITADGLARPDLLLRAVATSYAHDSLVPHLANNLAIYLLAGGSLYALGVRTRRRETVRIVFALALVAAPFVGALGSLALPEGGSTVGFSGSVATLLGALPPMLFFAAAVQGPLDVDPRWSAPPVFSVVTAVALFGGLAVEVAIAAAVATVVVTLLLFARVGVRSLAWGLAPLVRYRNPFSMLGTVAAASGAVLLFFSVDPRTNVAAHLVCYCFGYLAALFLVLRRPVRGPW